MQHMGQLVTLILEARAKRLHVDRVTLPLGDLLVIQKGIEESGAVTATASPRPTDGAFFWVLDVPIYPSDELKPGEHRIEWSKQ